MTRLLVIALILSLAVSASAVELGSHRLVAKSPSHVGQNPGTPDGREGGETFATAVPIEAIPFYDTGNTSDNIHDYEPICPYGGSAAPDVVYSYTPQQDELVRVDLCGSGYDTCVGIFDPEGNQLFCNDDYYFDDPDCLDYVSLIEYADLVAGQEYFIVVDGYGSDSGDYVLNITYVVPPEPCDLVCDGVEEGEPTLQEGYHDVYNSGCGAPDPENAFTELTPDSDGTLTLCAKSGWFPGSDGSDSWDTDWFTAVIGPTGSFEWTLDAEQELYGFLLGPNDCGDVAVVSQMTAGPCAPASMTVTGEPGQLVWLWAGPTEYTPPYFFEGFEFDYVCTFTGLLEGPVATDAATFGGVKSLYR